MTCNLVNNEAELRSSVEAVINSQTGNEWTIIEYDNANSNIIKLGAKGTGGMDELLDNFHTGKIQYGFGTVAAGGSMADPKYQRKNLLIHWQGESVPAVRLAMTAPHLDEIRKFFHVNLTIHARNEEDLDRESMAKQLEKMQAISPPPPSTICMPPAPPPPASNVAAALPDKNTPPPPSNQIVAPAASSEDQKKPPMPPLPLPILQQDFSAEEREKFWNQQRDEDEARRREEIERRRQIQEQFAREQRELAAQLHNAHMEQMIKAAACGEKPQLGKSQSLDASSGKMGKLISDRTQLFEQKMAELVAGSPAATKPAKKPKNFKWQVHLESKAAGVPVNLVPEPPPKHFECVLKRKDAGGEEEKPPQHEVPMPVPLQQSPTIPEGAPLPPRTSMFHPPLPPPLPLARQTPPTTPTAAAIPPPLKLQAENGQQQRQTMPAADANADNNNIAAVVVPAHSPPPPPTANERANGMERVEGGAGGDGCAAGNLPQQIMAEQPPKTAAASPPQTETAVMPMATALPLPPLPVAAPIGIGGSSPASIRAKAIWDYQAEDASELTFNPDDIICDIQMVHDGWWYGRAPSGAVGLFPSNYVQLVE